MGGVPSVPRDSTRTLQLINAGYSRTGTASMSLAMEMVLDGPVMHGGTQVVNREDEYVRKWVEVYRHRDQNDKPRLMKALREVTRGFVGISDFPGLQFIPELLELYPDAKVVCVTRDPQRWWKSLQVIMNHTRPRWLTYFMAPMPGWRWTAVLIDYFGRVSNELLGPGPIGPEMLTRHYDYVRRVVPKDKLMFMDLKEGWAPLCEFVGKPVPDEPFPNVNDAAAVDELGAMIFKKTAAVWVGIFSATGAAAWAGWGLWQNWDRVAS